MIPHYNNLTINLVEGKNSGKSACKLPQIRLEFYAAYVLFPIINPLSEGNSITNIAPITIIGYNSQLSW